MNRSGPVLVGGAPTAAAISAPRTAWRVAGPALVVALAVLGGTGGAVGAQVLQRVVIAEPGAGATVSTTGVVVDVHGVGEVDWVQARFVSASGKAGAPSNLAGPEANATGTRWHGNVDVAGLPNGAARVEARAQLAGGVTDWSGHEVSLDFPTPATSLQAGPVAGRHDAVALSWQPVAAPDVRRYEVHRVLAGGGWQSLVAVPGGQHAHTDVDVPEGTHRYRVRAVRPAADGSARPGPWAEREVAVAGPPAGIAAGGDAGASPGEPTAGVAPAPLTGGISARLRAGTEAMRGGQEGTSMAPQVAPREDVLAGGAGPDGLPVAAGPELDGEVALGMDSALQVGREGDPLGSDAVRLVGLFLAGVLAMRAQRRSAGGRTTSRLRLVPLLAPVGPSTDPGVEPPWRRPATSWGPRHTPTPTAAAGGQPGEGPDTRR